MPPTPRDTQPFSGASQTSQSPVLAKDEVGDLQLFEVGDIHAPDFSVYNLGDSFPGLVSTDGLGTVLYGNFVLCDWEPLKYPMAMRKWQALPGSFLQVDKPDTETGIVNPVFRRKQVATAINPGEYLPVPWTSATVFKEDAVIIGGYGVFICVTPGTSGATAPTWPVIGTIADGTAVWLYVSTAGVAWQASHGYTAPQQVIGGVYLFEAQGSGTSGSTPPAWPSSGTVTDGGVTWLNVGQAAMVVVEREDVNKYMAWEIITVFPSLTNNSFATGIHTTETISYTFPGRVNYAVVNATIGGGQGVINLEGRGRYAKNFPCDVLTYYVSSLTEPVVAWDEILTDDVFFSRDIDGSSIVVGSISDVIHDAYLLVLSAGDVSLPATTPTYTEYIASWIGQQKNIKGSILFYKYRNYWRVIIYRIVME